jgi:hypothetical protein
MEPSCFQDFRNRGDRIRTCDRPAPSRVRYQTAPLPVRGASDSTPTPWQRRRGPSDRRPGDMGTYVRDGYIGATEDLRTLPAEQAELRFRLAPQGARTTRQLLPDLQSGLQTRALHKAPRALHRERRTAQTGPDRAANRLSDRAVPRAPVRRLRRVRPAGSRVRPSRAQELRHRCSPAQPQLAGNPRRDRRLRGGLCKLSSSADCPSRRLRARGGSSTAEPRPSKAMMRVQFPSAASAVGGPERSRVAWSPARLVSHPLGPAPPPARRV